MYLPSILPEIQSVDDLRKFVEEELRRVALEMQETEHLNFHIHFAEPVKRVDGLVVYADGTSWNPGSGRGLYERRNGAWQKL